MGKNNQRVTRDYLEKTPEFDASTQEICRVVDIRGKGIVQVVRASGECTLAVLPPRFRGVLWLRKGALVITSPLFGNETSTPDSKVTQTIEYLLCQTDIKQFTKDNLMYTLDACCVQDCDSLLSVCSFYYCRPEAFLKRHVEESVSESEDRTVETAESGMEIESGDESE